MILIVITGPDLSGKDLIGEVAAKQLAGGYFINIAKHLSSGSYATRYRNREGTSHVEHRRRAIRVCIDTAERRLDEMYFDAFEKGAVPKYFIVTGIYSEDSYVMLRRSILRRYVTGYMIVRTSPGVYTTDHEFGIIPSIERVKGITLPSIHVNPKKVTENLVQQAVDILIQEIP